MSADAWRECPRCKAEFTAKPDDAQTLREDYEIFIDEDGEFYISYSAYCRVCEFEFNYDLTRQVYP